MPAWLWQWLTSLVSVSAVIAFAAYLLRNTVASFFSKSVENHFAKQMEAFKADIRDKENELDQIMTFLVSTRREHDSIIQKKRLESAEILLRIINILSQLTIIIEYMKILNVEEILKGRNSDKIHDLINTLIGPMNVDEKLKMMGEVDKTLPRLYLGEMTLQLFDAYQIIILEAVTLMRFLSIPLNNKSEILKRGLLQKTVTEIIPGTKESFEKWGDGYAYYFVDYFYDETLRALRGEVTGNNELSGNRESIERLALESRQAQANIRDTLRKTGLPDTLIKSDEAASAISSTARQSKPTI